MNKIQFQQKIADSDTPVIVDFWASWCAPCRVTKPVLEKLAKEYAGQVRFLEVNADDSREVLEQFRVYGIPTVIAFRGGKEVGRATGARGEQGYRAMFEALAAGKDVKIPLTPLDRFLRLGAGGFFAIFGIANQNWLLAGLGGVIAFMGIYDRCPIWNALVGLFKKT